MESGVKEGDVEMPMPGDFAGLQETSGKVKLTPRRNGSRMDELRQAEGGVKKMTSKYWECLKNHAASMGGHALDGCGEFMASGDEGSAGALKCATCECHRNFHRREVESAAPSCACHRVRNERRLVTRVGLVSHTQSAPPGTTTATSNGPADSDDQEVGTSASAAAKKKRFRTKFSTEQKEMMCLFADKLDWKIHKSEEADVQSFCAGIGVKRHAFKVWLHNNKHTLRKKLLLDDDVTRKSELSEPSQRKSESSEPSQRKSESSEPSERKPESPEPSERKSESSEPSERKSVSPVPSERKSVSPKPSERKSVSLESEPEPEPSKP